MIYTSRCSREQLPKTTDSKVYFVPPKTVLVVVVMGLVVVGELGDGGVGGDGGDG